MAEMISSARRGVSAHRFHWKPTLWDVVKHALMLLVVILTAFPLYWVVGSSLKRPADMFLSPPLIIFPPTLVNYQNAVLQPEFARSFGNSLVVALSVASLAVALGSLAAFGLARYRFPGSRLFILGILSSRLVPGATMIIPYFVLFRGLGLVDSVPGLILANTGFSLPFACWMMYGFFLEIPTELEDAGLVDGCTDFGIFWRIALPLTLPGLGATFILVFMSAWNEFLYALILSGRVAKTLPVYLASFIAERQLDWGSLFSVASVMVIPTFFLMLLVQRSLVRGLTAGAVKG